MMRRNKFYAFFILSALLSCASSSEKTSIMPFPDSSKYYAQPYLPPTTQPTDLLGAILQLQIQLLDLKLEIINARIEIEQLKIREKRIPEFKEKTKVL